VSIFVAPIVLSLISVQSIVSRKGLPAIQAIRDGQAAEASVGAWSVREVSKY